MHNVHTTLTDYRGSAFDVIKPLRNRLPPSREAGGTTDYYLCSAARGKGPTVDLVCPVYHLEPFTYAWSKRKRGS